MVLLGYKTLTKKRNKKEINLNYNEEERIEVPLVNRGNSQNEDKVWS
jgi:hypothetical protein